MVKEMSKKDLERNFFVEIFEREADWEDGLDEENN